MKEFIICTKEPLCDKDIFEEIKKVFPKANLVENEVYGGKYPNTFYVFLPSTNMDDPIDGKDLLDIINLIPIKNPYFTHVEFHKAKIAKAIVSALLPSHPELFIWYDDDNGYDAETFLKTEFEEWQPPKS